MANHNCNGCGVSVAYDPVKEKGDWNKKHPPESCSVKGTESGDKCPICASPMIWRVGPFSTFRACNKGKYVTGNRSDCPGRICAPRGRGSKKTDAPDTTPDTDSPDVDPDFDATPEETPMPATPAIPSIPAATDAGSALWSLIAAQAITSLAPMIEQAAKSAAAEVASKVLTLEWKANDQIFAKVDPSDHKAVSQVIALINKGFRNIFLVGPAGTGKSTVARSVAKALEIPFGMQSFAEGISEGAILGRDIPNLSTGESRYTPSRFVTMYSKPGVFCLDEMDHANDNAICTLNEALSNGHFFTPVGEIERDGMFIVIACANTYGNGADRMYSSANKLSAAFLNRFAGTVLTVGYDDDLEASLVSKVPGGTNLLVKVRAIREKIEALKLRRVFGTRDLIAAARHMAGGETLPAALRLCVEGWAPDEMTRVGISP